MGAPERVSAAELVRNFGIWQSRALQGPVVVTHRGRETHLLTSYRADEITGTDGGADWSALLDEVSEAVVAVDATLRIVSMNRVAQSIIAPRKAMIDDTALGDAIPAFSEGLLARYVARALRTGEPFAGDLRSPFSDHGWLRIKVVRSGSRAVLIFRDVTDELNGFAVTDTVQGAIRSLVTLGHVGQARLSVRGMIERADSVLRDRIGASEEALRRVAFSSLLPLDQRARFHDAFETAMRIGACDPIDAKLVGRTGDAFAARIGMARISGLYSVEGAVVTASWSPCVTQPCAAPPSPH